MGRRSRVSALYAWMNDQYVGRWLVTSNGSHEFHYASEWLASPAARPISLSMPLRLSEEPYRGPVVQAFFENLLPENERIRQRLQARFGAASAGAFDLLAEIGRDCVGALQLTPTDQVQEGVKRIDGEPLTKQGIEKLLTNYLSAPMGQRADVDDFRICIAGAQEKTALLRYQGQWLKPRGPTPTTHIFKLPIGRHSDIGIDLTTSVENEWLCQKIVAAYGIPVAHADMAWFGSHKVLVVERFDRRYAADESWLVRLPQEDMCQATGTPPGLKYESDGGPSITDIMRLLLGSRMAESDRLNFFKTQIVFWLLCAIDGHAKNFSIFLEPQSRFRLTPCYDVLSAYPILGHGSNQLAPEKLKMAMAVSGKNRHYRWRQIRLAHWQATAKQCGIAESVFDAMLEKIISETPKVIESVNAKLPKDFPAAVSNPILQGMKTAVTQLAQASGSLTQL
ncbi:MAG: type II toxin-antitoxin system HipA family toxin [Pseudomonadota bacterium]